MMKPLAGETLCRMLLPTASDGLLVSRKSSDKPAHTVEKALTLCCLATPFASTLP